MKKTLLIFALLLTFLWKPSFADEYYKIRNYHVNVDVTEDNIYHVKETIDVEFLSSRHGIYREIPVEYYNYVHDIENIYVTDEKGNVLQTSISKSGSQLNIRIGDPDIYVEGNQQYQISYDFIMGDDLERDFDQIYWNLIGNEWNTTIDKMSFSVSIPKETDTLDTLKVTYGFYGSTDSIPVKRDENTFSGEVENLLPNQAVTFRLDFEEGYFTSVAKPYKYWQFGGMFSALLAMIIASFRLKGKNRENNQIIPIVQFRPPEGLNPAEIKYIDAEEKLELKDISTLLLYWASKGYLKIVDNRKSAKIAFQRVVVDIPEEKPYEQELFNALFEYGNGQEVSMKQLKEAFYVDLKEAEKAIKKQYTGDREILVNSYQYLPGILMIVLFVLATMFIGHQLGRLMGISAPLNYIIVGAILFLFYLLASAMQFKNRKTPRSRKLSFPFSIIFGLFIVNLNVISRTGFKWSTLQNALRLPSIKDPWTILVIVSILLTGFVFWSLSGLKKYTDFSRDALMRVRGFKDFLEKAKVEEINAMFVENPTYYYDMLPYVYVFGYTKIWDKHLKALALPPPDWFVSDRPFRTYVFFNGFDRGLDTATSQPVSSSGSSSTGGFGGGGFSGGGGGGGGGGSW